MVHEWEAGEDEVRSSAWVALTMAIAFTAWHAYQAKNASVMPSSIWEITEGSLDDVLNYARNATGYDEIYVNRVRNHLVEFHSTDDAMQLGAAVDRDLLRKL